MQIFQLHVVHDYADAINFLELERQLYTEVSGFTDPADGHLQ